jgi:hypothetical protein
MSDLVKVYSPKGEMFENSPVNARDLVVHAGWSYDRPVTATAVTEPTPVIVPEIVTPEVFVVEPVAEEAAVEEVPEIVADEEPVAEEAPVEEVVAVEEVAEPVAEKPTRGRKKKS